MPWSETTRLQGRMRIVLDADEELFTITELEVCGRYGIGWMTGHKRLRRFRRDEVGGLEATSSAGDGETTKLTFPRI